MRIPPQPPGPDAVGMSLPDLVAALATGSPLAKGRYRHWDEVRRLTPPPGRTSEEWWILIKAARAGLAKTLPLRSVDDKPFFFGAADPVLQLLHTIDQRASGEFASSEITAGEDDGRRYLVSSLSEEAITSSQLEGANTTRKVAKEMIRTGRRPTTTGERMILNNFQGLEWVREQRTQNLAPDLVLELHRILTQDTIDGEDVGRIQRPGEQRVVIDDFEGNVLHRPPPAEQLPDRLDALCRFANGDLNPEGFLHPVVRSVLVHFWLAYDHPFVDGNGRTARALFYWSMLRQGYWLTEYLAISRILRKAPAKYGRSFLHTETDENDTTYFVLYQLEVICRAIDELHAYLARKTAELRQLERRLKTSEHFNHRQLALLTHALRNPDHAYTIQSHQRSHNVVYQSARTDLLDLAERGHLVQRQQGRKYVFHPAADLPARLEA